MGRDSSKEHEHSEQKVKVYVWEVVNKKNSLFAVRLTVRAGGISPLGPVHKQM